MSAGVGDAAARATASEQSTRTTEHWALPYLIPGSCGMVAGIAVGLSEDRATATVAVLFAVAAVLVGLRSASPIAATGPEPPGTALARSEVALQPTSSAACESITTQDKSRPIGPSVEVLDRIDVTWRRFERLTNALGEHDYQSTRPCADCGATTPAPRPCQRCGSVASAAPLRWSPGPDYSPFPTED